MNIIGIDPGMNGAVVCLYDYNKIETIRLIDIGMDVFDFLCKCKKDNINTWAYIEQIHPMKFEHPISQGKMMYNFGYCVGLLTGSMIPFEFVSPQRWKKAMGCIAPKGSTSTQKKNIDKALAQRLFPNIKITHAIADALLIAEYGRRLRKTL